MPPDPIRPIPVAFRPPCQSKESDESEHGRLHCGIGLFASGRLYGRQACDVPNDSDAAPDIGGAGDGNRGHPLDGELGFVVDLSNTR